MKTNGFLLAVLSIILGGLIFTSCEKDTNENINPSGSTGSFTDLNVAEGFTWSTSEYMKIELMFVDVDQNPVSINFQIFDEFPDGMKFMDGMSTEEGDFNRKYKISGHLNDVTVVLPGGQTVIVPLEKASLEIGNDVTVDGLLANATITVESPQFKSEMEETYAYYPGEGMFGAIAFEDTWPWQGDYDFNDVLIDYNVRATFDDSGLITAINMVLYLRASGAGYENGFGMSFKHTWSYDQDPLADIASVTVNGNIIEPEDTDYPSYILIDNTADYQPSYNTFMDQTFQYPTRFDVEIVMNTPAWDWWEVELPLNNPFIFIDQDRGREVHLPYYLPTALADPEFLGQGKDASDPEAFNPDNFKSGNMMIGYFTYMTVDEYPWAVNIYVNGNELFRYPVEFTDIYNAYYPSFGNWVETWEPVTWYMPEHAIQDSVYTKLPEPPYPELQ